MFFLALSYVDLRWDELMRIISKPKKLNLNQDDTDESSCHKRYFLFNPQFWQICSMFFLHKVAVF